MHLVVRKLGVGFLSSSIAFHIQSHKERDCEKTHFTSGMFDEYFFDQDNSHHAQVLWASKIFKNKLPRKLVFFLALWMIFLLDFKKQLPPVNYFNAYYVQALLKALSTLSHLILRTI